MVLEHVAVPQDGLDHFFRHFELIQVGEPPKPVHSKQAPASRNCLRSRYYYDAVCNIGGYNVAEWGSMFVLRILLLSSLMAVCVSAQSPPDKCSVSPRFELRGLVRAPQFRPDQIPSPSQDGGDQMGADPSQWFVQPSPLQPASPLPAEEQTCYSIRTYRVTRDDPQSDTTTPAGYSECETTTRFHIRAAVDAADEP